MPSLFASISQQSSSTNNGTILVRGLVLQVLGANLTLNFNFINESSAEHPNQLDGPTEQCASTCSCNDCPISCPEPPDRHVDPAKCLNLGKRCVSQLGTLYELQRLTISGVGLFFAFIGFIVLLVLAFLVKRRIDASEDMQYEVIDGTGMYCSLYHIYSI